MKDSFKERHHAYDAPPDDAPVTPARDSWTDILAYSLIRCLREAWERFPLKVEERCAEVGIECLDFEPEAVQAALLGWKVRIEWLGQDPASVTMQTGVTPARRGTPRVPLS